MLRPRKKVVINERNELNAEMTAGRTIQLRELSSGEKQLVIILGAALLQQRAPWVYIADEPELSLHVTWQEKLTTKPAENKSTRTNNLCNALTRHSREVRGQDFRYGKAARTTFRRTELRVTDRHLFLGVDAVVFLEGGKTSFTPEEVGSGSYTAQAEDLKYWQIVFSKFAPSHTLHSRAVGSKNTIKEIGLLAASGR